MHDGTSRHIGVCVFAVHFASPLQLSKEKQCQFNIVATEINNRSHFNERILCATPIVGRIEMNVVLIARNLLEAL